MKDKEAVLAALTAETEIIQNARNRIAQIAEESEDASLARSISEGALKLTMNINHLRKVQETAVK